MPGRLQPIHHRHLDIHQHHIEPAGAGQPHGLGAVFHALAGAVEHAAQGLRHQAIGGVVIGDKHVGGGGVRHRYRLGRLGRRILGSGQVDLEHEQRAAVQFAARGHPAAHLLGQLTANRQAQARAARAAATVGLGERVEQVVQLIGGDAGPCVTHLGGEKLALAHLARAQQDLDPPRLGELQGVAHQVVEDLLQAHRVPDQPKVRVSVATGDVGQPRLDRPGPPQGVDVLDQRSDPERCGQQLQPASLGP